MVADDRSCPCDSDQFLSTFRDALLAMTEPRSYETESAYQGTLQVEFQNRPAGLRIGGDPARGISGEAPSRDRSREGARKLTDQFFTAMDMIRGRFELLQP